MVDTQNVETKCMETNGKKNQIELLQVLHYVILKWVEPFLPILQKSFQGPATQMTRYQNTRLYYILAYVIKCGNSQDWL